MSEPERPRPDPDAPQREPKPIEKVKADNEKPFEKAKFEQEKQFEKVKSDHEKLPEKLKPEVEKLPKGEIEKIKPDKEKFETKEHKIEKQEIKEHKQEKFEIKENKLDIEKPPVPEKGIPEDQPPSQPIDRETLIRHAETLESMGRELKHFIEQSERPDLSRGALRNEPDQEGGSEGGT